MYTDKRLEGVSGPEALEAVSDVLRSNQGWSEDIIDEFIEEVIATVEAYKND